MLKKVIFLKKRKIFSYLFTLLVFSLCLIAVEVNFAQGQEETEKMKSIQVINPQPRFSLRLWLDKERDATYMPGERIVVYFQANQDSYVTIYSYDTEGRVKMIFPNQYSPNHWVRAGEINQVEGLIDPRSRPGIEYLQGFATTRPLLPLDREKELISKEFIPEVSKDYKAHTQSVKGIIASLPPSAWTSSNLLSYTVKSIVPPPPSYGRIVVTSHPQGAKVYLDNTYRGITPLNLDRVTVGIYQIKLEMSGYEDWNGYVTVSSSRTVTVSADLVPSPLYGSISVYCNEGQARIYLDGKYQKTTSANRAVELDRVEPGYHELKITKEGYEDWIATIKVTANKTYEVSAYLVPEMRYGSLAVSCNVSGAKIFINGTYKTTSSLSRPIILEEIKEGLYEITLIKDGYRTWVEEVEIYAGETTSLYVEMIEIDF